MEAMQNANRRALDYDRERGEAPPAVQTRRPSIQSIPGAHRVYPSNREPSPESGGEGSTANDIEQVQPTMNAHSQHLEQSDQVVAEAYTVEEPPSPPVATVIDTCFGIERKRLLIIASVGLGVISIVLGCVFGIIVVPSRNNRQQEELTCGPLCGHGTTKLPNPNKKVLGATCESWDTNSTNLVIVSDDATSCADRYTAAAYGCDCPGIEIPSDSCGMLCSSSDSSSDTSSLPDPDRVVKDIHNQELSCKDWQLKSHFETDSQECVNYNAVGALCGCTGNEMHPDSCGGICTNGQDFLHSPGHSIWNTACRSWDIYSMYLPSWYNNDKNETCEEYYSDAAYGCACPVLSDIEPECGTLCQQRRTCGPICEGGESEIPDPDLIVRRETCQAWELHSRLEVHEIVCPFYNMTGAQCGCKNKPVSDACGPLCGGESLPNPQKEVYGQTCETWDYMSTYLGPSYGKSEQNPIIKSCEEHFSAISYAFQDMRASPYTASFWTCADCSDTMKGLRNAVSIFLSTGYCIGSVIAIFLNLILPSDAESDVVVPTGDDNEIHWSVIGQKSAYFKPEDVLLDDTGKEEVSAEDDEYKEFEKEAGIVVDTDEQPAEQATEEAEEIA